MSDHTRAAEAADPANLQAAQALRIAWAGMAALAVAMGIGRFAFTPLLPMMLHDGVVDIAAGSWLATANYFGYLVGALLFMSLPWLGRRLGAAAALPSHALLVRGGLVATVLLTAALVLPWPPLWPTLRFGAGVASALVFLGTTNWCMGRLTELGYPSLGGLIFCGPGVGIVLTGLSASAMLAAGWVMCRTSAAARRLPPATTCTNTCNWRGLTWSIK